MHLISCFQFYIIVCIALSAYMMNKRIYIYIYIYIYTYIYIYIYNTTQQIKFSELQSGINNDLLGFIQIEEVVFEMPSYRHRMKAITDLSGDCTLMAAYNWISSEYEMESADQSTHRRGKNWKNHRTRHPTLRHTRDRKSTRLNSSHRL